MPGSRHGSEPGRYDPAATEPQRRVPIPYARSAPSEPLSPLQKAEASASNWGNSIEAHNNIVLDGSKANGFQRSMDRTCYSTRTQPAVQQMEFLQTATLTMNPLTNCAPFGIVPSQSNERLVYHPQISSQGLVQSLPLSYVSRHPQAMVPGVTLTFRPDTPSSMSSCPATGIRAAARLLSEPAIQLHTRYRRGSRGSHLAKIDRESSWPRRKYRSVESRPRENHRRHERKHRIPSDHGSVETTWDRSSGSSVYTPRGTGRTRAPVCSRLWFSNMFCCC